MVEQHLGLLRKLWTGIQRYDPKALSTLTYTQGKKEKQLAVAEEEKRSQKERKGAAAHHEGGEVSTTTVGTSGPDRTLNHEKSVVTGT